MDISLQKALKKLTSAYVSDARWPPAPTSPGRFNVEESIQDLYEANNNIALSMKNNKIDHLRSLYSSQLMKTQIDCIKKELMQMKYFGE